mgnify:CR=1 FL=1
MTGRALGGTGALRPRTGTAGRAGGRAKSGMHIDLKGGSVAQVGYTALRLLGVDTPSWGTLSNKTSEVIHDVVA